MINANASLLSFNKEINKIKPDKNQPKEISYREYKFLCKEINKFLDKNIEQVYKSWALRFNQKLRVMYSGRNYFKDISTSAKCDFTEFLINCMLNSKMCFIKKRKLFKIHQKHPNLMIDFPFIDANLHVKEF